MPFVRMTNHGHERTRPPARVAVIARRRQAVRQTHPQRMDRHGLGLRSDGAGCAEILTRRFASSPVP